MRCRHPKSGVIDFSRTSYLRFGMILFFLTCSNDPWISAQEKPAIESERKTEPDDSPGFRFRFSLNLPVKTPKKREIRSSTKNGVRTITVTDGDEQIEFSDTNGKKITFKHTRPVSGQPKTSVVEAADLEELKAKSPVLASFYEQYTAVPGAQVLAGTRFQFKANPRGRRVLQPGGGTEDEADRADRIPRRIRFEYEGKKIEIIDGVGTSIRMRVSRTVDGVQQTDEIQAENQEQFREAHPDLYRIYEKYAGTEADKPVP